MVAVYIARGDLESAWRRCDAHQGASQSAAQLKGDPILRIHGATLSGLNSGKVRSPVAIEVCYGKL